MLRTAARRYLAPQGLPSWQVAESASRVILRRGYATTSSQQAARPARTQAATFSNPTSFTQYLQRLYRAPLRSTKRKFHSNTRLRNSAKSGANETPAGSGKDAEPQGLSARLKKLSKEYGWAAVGVYFSLSVLDFPFCFLLVRVVGTEKIGQLEHFVVSNAAKVIPQTVKDTWNQYRGALKQAEKENLGNDEISEHVEMVGWGVEKAEARHQAEASLGTQLALAYAIHKSFIFLRVPLTAAVTPKVVKVLRSWGWKIGKRST